MTSQTHSHEAANPPLTPRSSQLLRFPVSSTCSPVCGSFCPSTSLLPWYVFSHQILHSLTLDNIDYCRFILFVRYDNTCVQTSSPCDSPDKQERWACIRPRLDLTRGKRQVRGDIWVTPHNTCKAQTRTGSGPHLKSVENVVVPAEL